ncbi:MAG: hypothetical protein PHC61_07760 [Chitinivibrionales bacterium]|nr:hypothetical protein [Chitinivibrionales bacterium]
MKNQSISLTILFGLLIAITVNGQEDTKAKKADANEVFNSIMLNMPADMKARVDSASVTQRTLKTKRTAGVKNSTQEKSLQKNKNIDNRDISLDKLPASVREEVQKTLKELENSQRERMLEFKESKDQKNGR